MSAAEERGAPGGAEEDSEVGRFAPLADTFELLGIDITSWISDIRSHPLRDDQALLLLQVVAQLTLAEELRQLRTDLRELLEPAMWLGRFNH